MTPTVLRKLLAIGALGLATSPWGHTAQAEPSVERTEDAADAAELQSLPIARVPLAVHRRAARWLEARRQTSDSVWFSARLSDRVTPMFRPGVAGTAYWEIPVLGTQRAPLGWIVLSSATHDFPVVGSASGGEPPSVELVRSAAAHNQSVARIYMPSPFTFIAENARGEVVAQIGSLPPRIAGADRSLIDAPDSDRLARFESDANGAPASEIAPAVAGVRYESWPSWAAYRDALAGSNAFDSEIVRKNAAPFWELEASVTEDSTRIDPLEVMRVPLLARGAAHFGLHGGGARHVAVERVRGPDGDEWLDLRVRSASSQVSELRLEIGYASGERERLGFALPARPSALPGPILAQAIPATCKRVALRTHKGYFVRVVEGGNGQVDAKAQRVGAWETLNLEQLGDGTVAFRQSSSGAYLAAQNEGGGKAVAVAAKIGPWEKFHPVPSTGGTYAFKSAKGFYLVAEGGGNGGVNVNRKTVAEWERFQVICNAPVPVAKFADNASETTAWARQRKYDQLEGNKAPNKSPCSSGCGATAWAMLIGYMDYAATQGVSRYAPYRRAYLSGGSRGKLASDTAAPEFLDFGTKRITLELRDRMNDWGVSGCAAGGSRFTSPTIMAQATSYFWGRIPARVRADYDAFFVSTTAGVNKVKHSLEVEKKAIAIGMHNHYPVAWGIRRVTPPRWDAAQKKWVDYGAVEWMVDANWGWGEQWSRSVPLYSWFYGTIDTAPYSRVTQITNGCKLRAQSGGATGRVDRDYKCDPQLTKSERHVGMEAAGRLIERDVLAAARAANRKVCLLESTDIQCAPCNTTDRLIVRMDIRAKTQACPTGTVNELR